MTYRQPQKLSAVDARAYAQELAFGPVSFYATLAMRDTGLLAAVAAVGAAGADVATLAQRTHLSEYAVSVLLDFGVDLHLVTKTDGRFALDHVGYFVLNDTMTKVNMNFTRDICYQALPFLEQSLREGRPAGLHTLGPWNTVYEGLSQLPEPAASSWFEFDHFYSDQVFDELLAVVFARPVRRLMDVGGNTGRWALKCLQHDPQVQVTLVDHPGQLALARQNLDAAGVGGRAHYYATDILDAHLELPAGMDVIWMSQFLDCFSEAQIQDILRHAAAVMGSQSRLYILEPFADRQAFDAAAFCLNATSLYFTCVANGNSRMYHYDKFSQLITQSGLRIEQELDLTFGHTLLCCRRSD